MRAICGDPRRVRSTTTGRSFSAASMTTSTTTTTVRGFEASTEPSDRRAFDHTAPLGAAVLSVLKNSSPSGSFSPQT